MAANNRFIFGIHAVMEALDAGKDLDKVLIKRGSSSDLLKKLTAELRKREISFQYVPIEKLNRVTRKNHQGVIASISEINYSDITRLLPGIFEAGEEPLILVLDGISDVRNFGAIARTAECAGIHAIVVPSSGSASINPDAIKTSAGALHRIPVCRHRDMHGVLRFLKESGLTIYAATEKGAEILYETDLRGPACVVMGSEDQGISTSLLELTDHRISIPMKGEISSLNVSVAAGVMLFEVIRQRAE